MDARAGSIPACITQLPELVEVHLDYNQLTGSLPAFATINSPLVFLTAAYQAGRPHQCSLCVACKRHRLHHGGP